MPYYNLGIVIRLTRTACGMSQEELSDGICSVQTLSRIENGKHGVKRTTYQQLMERMGRNGGKSYSRLSVDDLRVLDIMLQTNQELVRKNYDRVKINIDRLRPHLAEHPLNEQYVKKTETVLDYYMGRITKEEFLSGMAEAIAITVRDYESLLETEYPFTREEAMILMNIANVWEENGCPEKSIKILRMLMRSLDTGYMESEETVNMQLALINSLSIAYGNAGWHQQAIDLAERGIELSKSCQKVQVLPNYYLQIAWDMMEQIEAGERDACEQELCKKYLRQGYAAAELSKRYYARDTIKKYYQECFGEDSF